ncbi:hypothetical protein M3P36_05255 [Altererythrobacter sp. KTW20L]|uniref:hypothetical protein n=1 Tax=Altererythrobacter sp. KTW20L TaxID=2942210 RepID=UPI0020BFB627|nr:hypothetical protein [Altererythrobacter sp. KTW20L]MCL6250452.1 hypothetical protein [Altererythrobacter sp. KTW20L]
MKTTIALAALPLVLALGACSDVAEEAAPAEAVVADDDNDAPEPVVVPHDEAEPHDETVPHDH